jgi:FG-GAP repeat
VREVAESDDVFGDALTAADFSGDGFAELAVGVPGEDLATQSDAGAVNVLKGGALGLSGLGDEFWTQDSPGEVEDVAEANDLFGLALAD